MKSPSKRSYRKSPLIIGSVIVVVIASLLILRQIVTTSSMHSIDSWANLGQEFPDIDTTALANEQREIVRLLKQEHATQHPGTYYSEGIDEAWCADFVSWIMREAGVPLANPHSGSWRIPGVTTLQEYYRSHGSFRTYTSGYQPKLGDVVMYHADGLFGQHTNIVIKNDNGMLTTVGGNENGKIRVFTNDTPNKAMIIGYGIL